MYDSFSEFIGPYAGIITTFVYLTVIRLAIRVVSELGLFRIPETEGAPKLNLDKNGMPKDYTSYVWLLYKKSVEDESPARRAFLNSTGKGYFSHPDFGQQYSYM